MPSPSPHARFSFCSVFLGRGRHSKLATQAKPILAIVVCGARREPPAGLEGGGPAASLGRTHLSLLCGCAGTAQVCVCLFCCFSLWGVESACYFI